MEQLSIPPTENKDIGFLNRPPLKQREYVDLNRILNVHQVLATMNCEGYPGGILGIEELFGQAAGTEGYRGKYPADVVDWYPTNSRLSAETTPSKIEDMLRTEEKTFGTLSLREIIRTILYEEKGHVYLDSPPDGPRPGICVGYVMIIDKEMDRQNIKEAIEREAYRYTHDYAFSSTERPLNSGYYSDHNGFGYNVGSGMAEIYEIGTLPEYQGRGISTALLKLSKRAYESGHGRTNLWSIVRFNNLGSLKAQSRIGMMPSRLQAPSKEEDLLVSRETNFGVDDFIEPQRELPKKSRPIILGEDITEFPNGQDLVMPIRQGNESELVLWRSYLNILKKVMAVGRDPVPGEDYVVRMICKGKDLKERISSHAQLIRENIDYLYFSKNWKYKKGLPQH